MDVIVRISAKSQIIVQNSYFVSSNGKVFLDVYFRLKKLSVRRSCETTHFLINDMRLISNCLKQALLDYNTFQAVYAYICSSRKLSSAIIIIFLTEEKLRMENQRRLIICEILCLLEKMRNLAHFVFSIQLTISWKFCLESAGQVWFQKPFHDEYHYFLNYHRNAQCTRFYFIIRLSAIEETDFSSFQIGEKISRFFDDFCYFGT